MEPYARLIGFVNELRKTILFLIAAIIAGTILYYSVSPAIFKILQTHLNQKLSFFTVAEPFLSHVKLAFSVSIFTCMPGILYCFWRGLAKPFGLTGKNIFWFNLFTSVLFYSGAGFCYFVTLPLGVEFLLGFESEQLKPVISIAQFVSFVTLFILAFGIIFELPVLMIFGAKTGLCPRQSFEKNRRYAILIISVVAALLTPTPDIFNMLLMGLPLYLLYEAGIIIMKVLRI